MSLPRVQPPPLTSAQAALGDRGLFPDLAADVYANHAAVSPFSQPVREGMQQNIDLVSRLGAAAIPQLLVQRARLKQSLAELIGGTADEIGLVLNTTSGLSAIALCFPWQAGDKVIVFTGEFPTNVTPWQRAAELFGLKVFYVPVSDFARSDGPDYTRLDLALLEGVRLLSVSMVQFQTGLRMPIGEIAKRCRAQGTQICVDGIQAVGSMPVNVAELDIDYLACGGHKWMMGPEGAGFVWARGDRASALRPHLAGWLSHEQPIDFLFESDKLRYDKPIRSKMDFVESGVANAIGYGGLEVGIHLIRQVGIDVIEAHVQAWHEALEPVLLERGFHSMRASDPARRSGILSVRPPEGLSAMQLMQALDARGVSVATPDGLLRFAPHWPNHLAEVSRVSRALDESLASLE